MGAQAHKRTVAALQKQIVVQEKKVVEVRNVAEIISEFRVFPYLATRCFVPSISVQHSYPHKLCVFLKIHFQHKYIHFQ